MQQRNAGTCRCGADIGNGQACTEAKQGKEYAAKDDSAKTAKDLHRGQSWNHQQTGNEQGTHGTHAQNNGQGGHQRKKHLRKACRAANGVGEGFVKSDGENPMIPEKKSQYHKKG